jgi:hypothetical protein
MPTTPALAMCSLLRLGCLLQQTTLLLQQQQQDLVLQPSSSSSSSRALQVIFGRHLPRHLLQRLRLELLLLPGVTAVLQQQVRVQALKGS